VEWGISGCDPDIDLRLRWQRPDFYFGSRALEMGAEAPAAVAP
jgi:hypothetical protein